MNAQCCGLWNFRAAISKILWESMYYQDDWMDSFWGQRVLSSSKTTLMGLFEGLFKVCLDSLRFFKIPILVQRRRSSIFYHRLCLLAVWGLFCTINNCSRLFGACEIWYGTSLLFLDDSVIFGTRSVCKIFYRAPIWFGSGISLRNIRDYFGILWDSSAMFGTWGHRRDYIRIL